MSTDASVLSALEQPHCRICQRFDPQVGPDLAKALSNLTGTKGSAVPTGLACSYNPDDKTINFPQTIVTAEGDFVRLGPYDRQDITELPKGLIKGEAWAIEASRKTSGHSHCHIVLIANDKGGFTECPETMGKISSYNGQTCMSLFHATPPRLPIGETPVPFACVIPDTTHGNGFVDTEGDKEEGWSITSFRACRAPSGQVESSAGGDTDGLNSALNA